MALVVQKEVYNDQEGEEKKEVRRQKLKLRVMLKRKVEGNDSTTFKRQIRSTT